MSRPARAEPPLTDEQREFVERYWRYAEATVRRMNLHSAIDREEAQSAALLALCRAARTYNPARGVKPFTWALSCMRYGVIAFVRSQPGGCRYRRASCISLSTPIVGQGNNGMRHGELTVADAILGDDEETLLQAAQVSAIDAAIGRLPERERYVMERWRAGEPLREIGASLGVGESRAWQLQQQALKRLQSALSQWSPSGACQ